MPFPNLKGGRFKNSFTQQMPEGGMVASHGTNQQRQGKRGLGDGCVGKTHRTRSVMHGPSAFQRIHSFLKDFFVCVYVDVLPTFVTAPHVPTEARRGGGSPGARVTDSCEPPQGCWELNPGHLLEQPTF